MLIIYFLHQYDFTFWLGFIPIALAAIPFYRLRSRVDTPYLNRQDFWVIIGLIGFSVPIYLFMNEWLPFQVARDEVITCDLTRGAIDLRLLGADAWHAFPNFGFIAPEKIIHLFGKISIPALRSLNGCIGVAIVLALYFFYRTGWGMFASTCAALIAGFNHSLLAQSRSAYHANIDLLIETVTFACLIRAFQTSNHWLAFVGGLVAATGYYFYYPARSVMAIWALAVAVAALSWHRHSAMKLIRLFAVSAFGLALGALPQIVATSQATSEYLREQLLITPEGLHMYMERYHLTDIHNAALWNFYYQITCFNIPCGDAWAVYWNPDFAFSDAVTGVMLWVGLVVSIFTKPKSESEQWLKTLSLVAFAALMFVYGCIVNCAPGHSRLLIVLPFVGYLAQSAAAYIGNVIGKRLPARLLESHIWTNVIASGIVLSIVLGNLMILRHWFLEGLTWGDHLGSVMRYVQDRHDLANYKWYVATKSEGNSELDCFIPWTDAEACERMIKVLAGGKAEVHAITPERLSEELPKGLIGGKPIEKPLTIFFVRKTCPHIEKLIKTDPEPLIHDIIKDSSYQAIELLPRRE